MESLPNNIINLGENLSEASNYSLNFVAFILCAMTSFVLKYVYINRSNSLSPKSQLGFIIPILSLVTFLVILIVKSSLALSLGLVGALSVIRFRTPIKEPEDLAYLFLAIGIGIGYGALQIIMTTGIFLGITFIIYLFLSKKDSNLDKDFNLILEFKKEEEYFSNYENLINMFKDSNSDVSLIKLEKNSENIYSVYLKINFTNFEQIQKITKGLSQNFPNIQYSIYESKILF